MHELSLCRVLLRHIDQITTNTNNRKITVIHLTIGALTCIDLAALEFSFHALSRRTIAENTRLQYQIEAAIALCHNCEEEFPAKTLYSFCPNCQSEKTILIKGNEFMLNAIEVQ